jgi:radical SAM superfamily enzyme YgiQ (UPF0313 family)
MNILVINVSLRIDSPRKVFPIGLGYVVTAMDRAGYKFDLVDIDAHKMSDEQIEKEISKKHYDVMCIGCVVTGYRIVKPLLELVREKHKDCKIIVGNSVATSIVDILFEHTPADVAVMLEGDETIVDLLDAIENNRDLDEVQGICYKKDGEVIKTEPRKLIDDISTLPMINFELFEVEKYLDASVPNVAESSISLDNIRTLPITTARGCIAKCTFCYHVFNGKRYRYRSAPSIVEEIKHLKERYNVNYVQFLDELTFYSRRQTEELVDLMIAEDLGIYWTATCRSNLFTKPEDIKIIEKMRQAGLEGIQYSLESADPDILKMMKKKCRPEHFDAQSKLFQSAGVTTWTSLVFGYPQETEETIKRTFDVCIANRIYPSVGFLLPQPESVMYDYALEHGYIVDEEEYVLTMGERQDLRINMTRMSDEDLFNNVLDGLKRCNEELKMGLDEKFLIKTQKFKKNNHNNY